MMELNIYHDAPTSSGVYIMKDKNGNVLYVGKAKNIKKRLLSYFKASEKRYQISFLTRKIATIDYILTNNEKEALILENNLIKKYNPKYNIQLKDDKNYLCIKIDTKKDFPKIELVRRIDDKSALYFGPYPSAKKIREILSTLQKIFPLRHCSDSKFKTRTKPCLYFDMGQCIAPCIRGEDKKAEYKKILEDVILFLEGRSTKKIKSILTKQMWEASKREDFEKAGFIRDIIFEIDELLKKQAVQGTNLKSIDVIGFFEGIDFVNFSMLFIRGGKLLSKKDFSVKKNFDIESTLSEFITKYYQKDVVLPEEIIIDLDLEGKENIENYLHDLKGSKISIKKPYDSQTKQLISMAKLNASSFTPSTKEPLTILKNIFNLDQEPERIECFDATHLYGRMNACVMIVFENGDFAKDQYRIFNMEEEGFDDYKSLYNALLRRFKHHEWKKPDILIIDGGKGQLNTAKKALDELKIKDVFLMAIAKDQKNSIYISNRKNPIILKPENEGLKLLIKLREESHRFANNHLKRRLKKYFVS
ncbi:MAG: excinuclease ABC subunit UvrC [Proteobacteria bacterium]|nr:excinuclease ABC subunit UvrC [Pseudomonadota bacterium]